MFGIREKYGLNIVGTHIKGVHSIFGIIIFVQFETFEIGKLLTTYV